MYHTGPLSGMRLLCAGVPSVILSKFDPEATLAAIDTYKTETSVMVPTHFVRLLALPDDVKAKYDVSSMKMLAHTGAKCPVEVKAAMIEWFGPVFRDAYGASEVGTVCTISSEEWLEHQGSVGRSVPPFSAVILDDDMKEVAAGVEGRLFFRDATGRGIIYPNDAEKTAASNPEPGLFTLGEIGYMDADGYVFITDRFSDMVVSGGANLYPAEAEQLLIDHPGVADVGCVGVPHPDMGEMLIALVMPTDPEFAAGPFRAVRLAARAPQPLQVPSRVPPRLGSVAQHDGQDQQAPAPRCVARRRPRRTRHDLTPTDLKGRHDRHPGTTRRRSRHLRRGLRRAGDRMVRSTCQPPARRRCRTGLG